MLLVLIGFVGVVVESQINYCARRLCRRRKHVACNNNRQFANDCPDDRKLIQITPNLKQAIVKKHNELRNQLASGEMPRFDKALRMATMVWDVELEQLAELNIMKCKYAHDECHSTWRFPKPGQNIARYMSSTPFTSDITEETCIAAIDLWWSEHEFTSKSDIGYYPKNPSSLIGHFTCMAIESNWAVGCAAGKYNDGDYVFAFTCNYAKANIIREQTYLSGTNAASLCLQGRNPEFPGLCSTMETYSYRGERRKKNLGGVSKNIYTEGKNIVESKKKTLNQSKTVTIWDQSRKFLNQRSATLNTNQTKIT